MSPPPFPRVRWLAPAWLAVYLPAYTLSYGPANFLFLCNIALVVSCVGLWRGSALLLSASALSSIVVDTAWTLDFAGRLLLGRHPIGGTEYMWDPRWPLFTRLLSLYHVALPALLLIALRRTGYDRRAWLLQSLIAVAGVIAGRLVGSHVNINYAYVDPILRRSWQPAALHLALIAGALVGVVYPLTHAALARLYPPVQRVGSERGRPKRH